MKGDYKMINKLYYLKKIIFYGKVVCMKMKRRDG